MQRFMNVLITVGIPLAILVLFSWEWFRESPLVVAFIGVIIVIGLLSCLGMSFLGAKAIVTKKLYGSSGAKAVVWGIVLLIINVGALVAVYYGWFAGYEW